MTSCGTRSVKTTPFRFQYSVGRTKCPACHKQKSLITEDPSPGPRTWCYCFNCKISGPLRYVQDPSNTYGMSVALILQGFRLLARKEFLTTSADTASRGLLGIPFRPDDPLRLFYDEFIGYGPMRTLSILREKLPFFKSTGWSRQFWTQKGLIIAIEDWPGRIDGFLCLTPGHVCTIRFNLPRCKKPGLCYLRTRPTERRIHFDSLSEACQEGTMYASLGIDVNITCDPVL
jgi:hypothetical protein